MPLVAAEAFKPMLAAHGSILMGAKVVHFEIPADDIKRAKAFYQEVFGWEMNESPGMEYVLVGTTKVDENGRPTEPGAINGGMTKKAHPVEAPVITIQVDEIDDALREVETHGGKTVVKKTAMGEWAFFGYFEDPEGNVMGLFQRAAKT